MKCKVCNYSDTISDGISILCLKCETRFNLNAKNIDYLFEGGQDIPTDKKILKRIENSKNRMKIIKKLLNWVDVVYNIILIVQLLEVVKLDIDLM